MYRTRELDCAGDIDFLAKLYCVRLAFDQLTAVADNSVQFQQMGREIMSSFLTATGNVRSHCVCVSESISCQDPALFCERFDGLLSVLEGQEGRRQAELELRERKVCSNMGGEQYHYTFHLNLYVQNVFT